MAKNKLLSTSRISIFFGILLVADVLTFIFWGLDYTLQNNVIVFVLASLFGLFMAFNIGGNDVANSFGTSVGAKTLTIKQALAVAAVFEVSGAVIAGGEVTKTIRKGIVDLSSFQIEPIQFVYIMMSALIAAALWLLFATRKGWPVSTTHSIIGGIVGASLALGIQIPGVHSLELIQWNKIGQIVVSWILSPVLGGTIAYALYFQIKKHIINYNLQATRVLNEIKEKKKKVRHKHKTAFDRLSDIQKIAYNNAMARDTEVLVDNGWELDSMEELESEYYRELYEVDKQKNEVKAHKALENWVPIIAAMGAMVISAMLLFKGLKHMNLGLTPLHNYLIMSMVGVVVWLAAFLFAKTLRKKDLAKSTFIMFSWMQVFTASGFAFSHGSNDIANAIGPFAAILEVIRTGEIGSQAPVPTAAMIAFGIALIAGLWFIGKAVIKTVGTNLAAMHPASGFTAELAAAMVVMLASVMGLPVSSTHILVGAVLGIGMVNSNANWKLMKPIAMAWVITLPVAGIVAGIALTIFNSIF